MGRILQRSWGFGSLLEASRDTAGGPDKVLCLVIAGEDIACDGVCGLGIAFLCFLLWVVAAFLAEFVLKNAAVAYGVNFFLAENSA